VTARLLLFVLLALAVVAAGCGGDDEGKPIPAATASALNAQLDNVQGRLDNGTAGACKDILEGPRDPNVDQVNQIIESMPDDVDSDVRSALQDSFDNLWDRVNDKCDELAQKQEQQQPTETQTTPTVTETQTETTPTETTPTETTPPQDEQLPGGEGNGNGGAGNGNGNGTGDGGGTGVGGGVSPDGANLGGGG
jgi:hypothetical protein